MIIDVRKTKKEIPELQADQSPINRVSFYKLLGVWIDNNLKWETNTWALIGQWAKRPEKTVFFKTFKELWSTYKGPVGVL